MSKIENISEYQINFEKINSIQEEVKSDVSKEKRDELYNKLTEILRDLNHIENPEYVKRIQNQVVDLSRQIEEKFEDSEISRIMSKAFDVDLFLKKGDREEASRLASAFKENRQSFLDERCPSPSNRFIITVAEVLINQALSEEPSMRSHIDLRKQLEELILLAEELEIEFLSELLAEELGIEDIFSLKREELRYKKISFRRLPRYAKKTFKIGAETFAGIAQSLKNAAELVFTFYRKISVII